jgi:nickel transport protein
MGWRVPGFWGLLMVAVAAGGPPAEAHGVDHRVDREGDAVVVTIAYAHGGEFAHEQYEVFRPGETEPYQAGRTDARGRVVFLPDTAGSWRVRAFTADGHGLDVTVEADPAAASAGPRAGTGRTARLIGVMVLLLGTLGLAVLYRLRTREAG